MSWPSLFFQNKTRCCRPPGTKPRAARRRRTDGAPRSSAPACGVSAGATSRAEWAPQGAKVASKPCRGGGGRGHRGGAQREVTGRGKAGSADREDTERGRTGGSLGVGGAGRGPPVPPGAAPPASGSSACPGGGPTAGPDRALGGPARQGAGTACVQTGPARPTGAGPAGRARSTAAKVTASPRQARPARTNAGMTAMAAPMSQPRTRQAVKTHRAAAGALLVTSDLHPTLHANGEHFSPTHGNARPRFPCHLPQDATTTKANNPQKHLNLGTDFPSLSGSKLQQYFSGC